MPSWQSTSRIGCPIDNPARRSRGAAPSTRPQWTRVPLDFRPRWRYVVNKAGAANAAPALKYKFYFTPHFCGYTEFGIVPQDFVRTPPSHKICKADSFLISRPLQWPPFLIYQHCIKGTFHFTFKKRAEVLQI